ncbi:hypothetical protein RNJ44_02717 [Nakaseomyces bracarensis]|uniref:ER membrane protein complex subunit 10 n=1 Tax=Nakaseomyces bracarensis TaxID=273131 RepID=A0ABR4P015_9SACH
MVSLKLVQLGLLLACARGEVYDLFAKDVDSGEKFGIGHVAVDDDTHNVTEVSLDKFKHLNGVYCFGAQSTSFENDCFSYLRVDPKKNSYSLAIDMHGEKLEGFSLFREEDSGEEVSAKVRKPVLAPQPPAIKLRKKTMTYAEKKAESKLEAVQKHGKEADDVETEEDQRTFIERNWKKMLIGFLIYNGVVAYAKQQQQPQQQ